MQDLLARYNDADVTERRRISVAIRLALYERPIAPAVLDPLLAAWRAERTQGRAPSAGGAPAPVEDPARARLRHVRARRLGRAVDHECAPLQADPRPLAGRYRHGGAHPTAGRCA